LAASSEENDMSVDFCEQKYEAAVRQLGELVAAMCIEYGGDEDALISYHLEEALGDVRKVALESFNAG
jgi:hypothetical protein